MAQPHSLALPPTFSPDTLDVLTHLSTILSEVRTALQTSTGIEKPGAENHADAGGGNGAGNASAGATGLTFKDVARASDGIKHKLQRAREHVQALPDMQRGIEEQEAEMRELESRMERQRALLVRLREEGLEFGKGQGEGDGTAGGGGEQMQEA